MSQSITTYFVVSDRNLTDSFKSNITLKSLILTKIPNTFNILRGQYERSLQIEKSELKRYSPLTDLLPFRNNIYVYLYTPLSQRQQQYNVYTYENYGKVMCVLLHVTYV